MTGESRRRQFELASEHDELCDRFESAWERGEKPEIESFLAGATSPKKQQLLRELLAIEVSLIERRGQVPDEARYHARFPEFHDLVADVCRSATGSSKMTRGEGSFSRLLDGQAFSEMDSRILAGREFDSYRLLSLLGEGGMGQVWKARHIKLEKFVALKVLSPRVTARPDAVARFEREMKAIGRLEHQNIVRALDAGEVDGIHFLVLEYIEGLDLAHYVLRKGPRPAIEACEMIRQAALGLDHAFQHGLVHRDIKPSNLFFARSGHVKVLDLGLALLQSDSTASSLAPTGLTDVGQIMGTPDYMAPEQCLNSSDVDQRADLYALGCTLFFLLTGRAPLSGDQFSSPISKLMAHMNGTLPSPKTVCPELPDDLCDVYQRLTQKNPADRFQSGAEVASVLKEIRRRMKKEAAGGTDDASRELDSSDVSGLKGSFDISPLAADHSVGDRPVDRNAETQNISGGAAATVQFPLPSGSGLDQRRGGSTPSIQLVSTPSVHDVRSTSDRRSLRLVASVVACLVAVSGLVIWLGSGDSGGRDQTRQIVSLDSGRSNRIQPQQSGAALPDGAVNGGTIANVSRSGDGSGAPSKPTKMFTSLSNDEDVAGETEPLSNIPDGDQPGPLQRNDDGATETSAPKSVQSVTDSRTMSKPDDVKTVDDSKPERPKPVQEKKLPVGPKTIFVGPEPGMTATFAEALRSANGNDTIEIATNEPQLITEPLVWDQPGTLAIRAAEGYQPVEKLTWLLVERTVLFADGMVREGQ